MQLNTGKSIKSFSIVEQFFDMWNICMHPILFELCVRNKEEEEQNQLFLFSRFREKFAKL